MTKLEIFKKTQSRKDLPEIRTGDTVKVYQKIKEKGKERIQPFEGLVIAKKHGKGAMATFTVRKLFAAIGVEKVYPMHSPTISKIEVVKKSKIRRAKLYWVRGARGKRARMKQKSLLGGIPRTEEVKETEEETEQPSETKSE